MKLVVNSEAESLAYQSIEGNSESYTAFPTKEQVAYNEKQLLAVGLLSLPIKDELAEILLAVPISQGTFYGDVPCFTYSLTEQGWQVEEVDELSEELESHYMNYYKRAKEFFAAHSRLTFALEEDRKSEPLFQLGGQPPLGCNWDDGLSDDLDDYFDALEDEETEEYEFWSSREIVYQNEGEEYIYLGAFSYDTYLDGGGDSLFFYQPKQKKIVVFAEFS